MYHYISCFKSGKSLIVFNLGAHHFVDTCLSEFWMIQKLKALSLDWTSLDFFPVGIILMSYLMCSYKIFQKEVTLYVLCWLKL